VHTDRDPIGIDPPPDRRAVGVDRSGPVDDVEASGAENLTGTYDAGSIAPLRQRTLVHGPIVLTESKLPR
jgi:hypothetical protein